jgi:hypothetical protein
MTLFGLESVSMNDKLIEIPAATVGASLLQQIIPDNCAGPSLVFRSPQAFFRNARASPTGISMAAGTDPHEGKDWVGSRRRSPKLPSYVRRPPLPAALAVATIGPRRFIW